MMFFFRARSRLRAGDGVAGASGEAGKLRPRGHLPLNTQNSQG